MGSTLAAMTTGLRDRALSREAAFAVWVTRRHRKNHRPPPRRRPRLHRRPRPLVCWTVVIGGAGTMFLGMNPYIGLPEGWVAQTAWHSEVDGRCYEMVRVHDAAGRLVHDRSFWSITPLHLNALGPR